MRIVLTGGGTGGHIIPLLAVAKKIREKAGNAELIFIGPKGRMEEQFFRQEGIRMKNVLSGKFRRYFSLYNFVDFFKIPIGIVQALVLLFVEMPDVIFSKGGYASLPVVLAGWLYRIPILIHESDSVPGLTNTLLVKLSGRVAISYLEAAREFLEAQVVLTGNPLRSDINQGDPAEARRSFSLSGDKKIIFIYGGSQGAQTLNDSVLNILPELLKKYAVIHQTGERNIEAVKQKAADMKIEIEGTGYHPVAFIGPELKHILAVADVVVTRAGANSLAEVAANGRPAIVVPLESSANDHQIMNADAIAREGGCLVLAGNNLGPNLLLSRIEEIMNSPELAQKLSINIRKFYHPEAADKLADWILSIAKK